MIATAEQSKAESAAHGGLRSAPSSRGSRDARTRVLWSGMLATCAWAVFPTTAHAIEWRVEAVTAAQGYEVASPFGNIVLKRRRLTQTLGLRGDHIQGDYDPGDAHYHFVTRFRVDADFGINAHLDGDQAGGETNYGADGGSRFVPGLERAPLELDLAYLEGVDLAGGVLDFKIGRQPMMDSLGFWSFDGLLVRFKTPLHVQIEPYGGFEERGGLPLSSSRFESQGVWRGSHEGFDQGASSPAVSDFPSYQYTQPAPAFGVAVSTSQLYWLSARVNYRRVYNQGSTITRQFPDVGGGYRAAEGLRISSDRLGAEADAPLLGHPDTRSWGRTYGGARYDFYNALFDRAYAGVDGYPADRLTVGANWERYEPTFDADSIFNFFTKEPSDTFLASAQADLTRSLSVSASGGTRLWYTAGDPDAYSLEACAFLGLTETCAEDAFLDGALLNRFRPTAHETTDTAADGLANAAASYRWGGGRVRSSFMAQAGERGRRVGGDLAGEKDLDGGLYTLGASVSLYDWSDASRPDRDATSFGYVLGGSMRPIDPTELAVQWEHNMNRLVGQRYRIVGVLRLEVEP